MKGIKFNDYTGDIGELIAATANPEGTDVEKFAYEIDKYYNEFDGGEVFVNNVAVGNARIPYMALEYAIPAAETMIALAIKDAADWFDAEQEAYIDWGDATAPTVVNASSGQSGYISHEYALAGTYLVKVSGSMKKYGRNSDVDIAGQTLLTRVDSFGKLGIASFEYAFRGCTGLTSVPKTLPSTVTNIRFMFWYCNGAAFNPDVSNWDVSKVENMSYIFGNCSGAAFNPDVSNWDVSKVENMSYIFGNCTGAALNPDVSNWDVSKATIMYAMFYNCRSAAFNPDVSNWDVSKAENMNSMFRECYGAAFNPDVSNWDVSKVTNMQHMFRYCRGAAFNPDMESWTLKTGVTTTSMFDASRIRLTTWLDELLIAWAANSEQGNNITINFYPNSFTEVEGAPLPEVADALAALEAKGWSITTANPYSST